MACIPVHCAPLVRRLAVVFLLAGLWLAPPVQAGIYIFRDANGVQHFTNKPDVPQYAGMQRIGFIPERSTPRRRAADPERYRPLVEQAAREHDVDEALLHAVITVESDYDPRAVSPRGAVGLMQLMPHTARRFGVRNSYDPEQNIRGGARYLRELMGRFNNDLPLVLAAYNAGEEAVAQHGNRIPPYRETRSYVPRVLDYYRRFQRAAR